MAETPMPDRATSVVRGRAARRRAPLEAHAELLLAPDRDSLALLQSQEADRLADLLPLRYGRMAESAFAFFRGAALPMAADLAGTPTSGLRVQLCGDAHLSNFGAFASPERRLVFDLNDFDETLPGPFEWDVKRLIASMDVAARANGMRRKDRTRIARATAAMYRRTMAGFAKQSLLDVWYARLDVDELLLSPRSALSKRVLAKTRAGAAKARTRDGMQALRKLTTVVTGERRIISDPPLVTPLEELAGRRHVEAVYAEVQELLDAYAATVSVELRHLVGRYRLTGLAHKVVGVGSIGTACWILLMEPYDGSDPLLLQAKQAQPSVLAAYVGESEHDNQAQRVVVGQRLMQAAGDAFLGWQRTALDEASSHDYYVRQLRDWKFSVAIAGLDEAHLRAYGRLCGWTLARAHARTGDRHSIAAYLGDTDTFDRAVAEFGEAYADLAERDHAALQAAIAGGRIKAQAGI